MMPIRILVLLLVLTASLEAAPRSDRDLVSRVRELFGHVVEPKPSSHDAPPAAVGYGATDIHRDGDTRSAGVPGHSTRFRRRPQRAKHHVADRLVDVAAHPPMHQLDRREAFPRDTAYRPATLFRSEPSTRRVRDLLRVESRLLVATEGGLLVVPPRGRARTLLPGVEVYDLGHGVADREATLVATKRGLFRLRGESLEQLHSTPTMSVAAVPSRGLRLTGHQVGLVQWVSEAGAERISRIQTRSPIRHLLVHDRLVFAGNGEGLWTIDSEGVVYEEPVAAVQAAHPITWIGAHGGAVHVGTPAGLFRRGPSGWRRLGPPVHVLGGNELDGILLIGTADDGVFELREDTLVRAYPRLPVATAFARGPGDRLYVGTYEQGLARETPSGFARVVEPSAEPPGNHITGLAWADERRRLFVGTFDYGVGALDVAPRRWEHLGLDAGLPSLWTNEVASDGRNVAVRVSDGTVAVAGPRGRFRVQGPKIGWPKTWTSSVSTIGGELLVTTHGGFYRGAPGRWTQRFPIEALEGRMVLAVTRRHGRTYVGTHKSGLWVHEGGSWRQFSIGTGLPDSWIPALAWYHGDLWAATFHGGLLRFPNGEVDPATVEVFRAASSHLPGDHIQALLVAADHLWIGTQHGLGVLDKGRWHSFHMEDGLPSESVTALASDERHLWVGTRRGLVEADLARLLVAAGSH